jgi:hypothetical protein
MQVKLSGMPGESHFFAFFCKKSLPRQVNYVMIPPYLKSCLLVIHRRSSANRSLLAHIGVDRNQSAACARSRAMIHGLNIRGC